MSLCPVDFKQCQCDGTHDSPCFAVEALRKDAERYRWLRNKSAMASANAPAVCDGIFEANCLFGDELDAATDAAMKEHP